MRVGTFTLRAQVSFLSLFAMSFYGTAFAEDLGGYATTCEEIGFKPRSEAFGNCVLELRRRNQKNLDAPLPDITSRKPERRAQRDTGIQHPTAGDGTPDDLTCQKFGISPGTDAYGQCRVQLKTAAETAQRQHAVYEQQRRDSEQQIAAQEEARRKRERDQASNNLIEYGLRLMGGQAPIDAALGVQGKPPITRQIAPQDPVMQNFQINTPGGFANCTYNSALRIMNCF